MTFKAKLRKIGNSLGVIIPKKVITKYKEGDEIGLDVITHEGWGEIGAKAFYEATRDKSNAKKNQVFNVEKGIYE